MAFPPQTPLHDHWEADLWANTVAQARKELLQQLKRELPLAAPVSPIIHSHETQADPLIFCPHFEVSKIGLSLLSGCFAFLLVIQAVFLR